MYKKINGVRFEKPSNVQNVTSVRNILFKMNERRRQSETEPKNRKMMIENKRTERNKRKTSRLV